MPLISSLELQCLFFAPLNNAQLGRCNVQSIHIGRELGISLLGAVWSDESVDLDGVDIIHFLDGCLDLWLVGFDVDNEHEGVVLLNLLHCALSVERVEEDLGGIETSIILDSLARVLGRAAQLESLGAVERSRQSDLLHFVRVDAFERAFGSSVGLLLVAGLAFGGSFGF